MPGATRLGDSLAHGTAKPRPLAAPAFIKDLFARGHAAEQRGDISAARRYYAIAADNGLADAARALGRLYDPAYLHDKTVGGIDPDPDAARRWYERADELGGQNAASFQKTLSVR
jgi:TPR repeat protein